ncbi:diacylglycerol kinase [Geobacillus subterraneus]|uniref:Diacylglycerol kinase n=2 Tax=Geobacillus TaxID=129337 RepID=A0ABN4NE46_9BACL|nr:MULTISPECIES: diacylglycerol kinase family protein [Geobacillus]AMX82858.1 diacylglycerol kinase [Geobacillus subterraneus]KZS26065.1 diacylglycerol kinase [Geobacillus subterraneus]OXB90949.1 diacylglycerol kinase [Geobacillus uzenensis]QIZ68406.1 diacylglycerol kinase family protein [Geobacillus subterraneus]WPZ17431.1 diacylglycerol kinase family protein [Geobacillus subterraneus]
MRGVRERDRFAWAWSGMKAAVKEEAHLRFHLAAAVVAFTAGGIVGLSRWEWAVLLLTVGAVITLELVNTAIERAVDLVTDEFHPLAKAAKDIAAAAVLVAAGLAVIIGVLLFWPHLR